MLGRGVDDGAGGEHRDRGGHFHGFHLVRPAPHQGEDIEHAVALLAVVAVHCPLDVVAAVGERGLPTANLHIASRGLVVVDAAGLVDRAVDVFAQGHALVGQLGILLGPLGAGGNDPLLHVGDLQGVRRGIRPAAHQVRDGQHGADEDLFVVFAGISRVGVVGEHRAGLLGQAPLRVVVQRVAGLAKEFFGLLRPPGRQFHHRPIELEGLGLAGIAADVLVQRDRCRFHAALVELGANLAQRSAWLAQPAASKRVARISKRWSMAKG